MGWLGSAMGLRWLALGSPDRVAGGRIPLMIRDAKSESQTTRNRLHNAAFHFVLHSTNEPQIAMECNQENAPTGTYHITCKFVCRQPGEPAINTPLI